MKIESSETVSRREFLQLGFGALYMISGGITVVDAYQKLADWHIDPQTGCMKHDSDQLCMTARAREDLWDVYNQNARLPVETDYTWLNTHLARIAGAYLVFIHGAKEFGNVFNKIVENSDWE